MIAILIFNKIENYLQLCNIDILCFYMAQVYFSSKKDSNRKKNRIESRMPEKHTYVYSKHNKNYTLYAISLDISIEKVNILMKHSRNMHYRLYAL